MRILLISYHTCPLASLEGKETGGMNVYVLELAKALGRAGHQVDMVTRAAAPDNPEKVEIAPGVRLFHLPAGPLEPVHKKLLPKFIEEFSANISNLVKNNDLEYDVIHAHYYLSGLVAQQLHQIKGCDCPVVMTFHTLALMKNLVGRSEGEKEDQFRVSSEQQLVKFVNKIISPTSIERDYLQYLYDTDVSKITVISPGVDTQHFTHQDQQLAKQAIGAEPDHKVLLFVGRIEPLKGIDALLYAMKILKIRLPKLEICLWIVGGDISQPVSEWSQELQRLEIIRRELQLESSVHFVGQQPQEKLPSYYNAADLLVMPSHYEAFGMVALEAMACGTPVITSNVAGIATLIDQEHEEIITTANNPLLLASQIEYLLTHPKEYQHIQQSLLKKAEGLDWSIIAQKISAVYQAAQDL